MSSLISHWQLLAFCGLMVWNLLVWLEGNKGYILLEGWCRGLCAVPARHSAGWFWGLVSSQYLISMRSQSKIIQMRRDIEHNPHKYLSNTPGGVQAPWSTTNETNHLIPTEKPLLILFSRWDVVSLHPLGAAEHKTTSIPIPCQQRLHHLRSFSFLFIFSMRWMSRWRMLRSLGRRCLGRVERPADDWRCC